MPVPSATCTAGSWPERRGPCRVRAPRTRRWQPADGPRAEDRTFRRGRRGARSAQRRGGVVAGAGAPFEGTGVGDVGAMGVGGFGTVAGEVAAPGVGFTVLSATIVGLTPRHTFSTSLSFG